MTITTIITATPSNEQDAAETQRVTRADVRGTDIRLFEGKRKVATLPLPDDAPAAVVEGILAAYSFPCTVLDLRDHLETALINALARIGSIIPEEYRYKYGADQNNGDAMALAFRDYCNDGTEKLDLSRLVEVASTNGIADRLDIWQTKGLNNGQLRMNAGNVLRGMYRRGEVVRIGDRSWNTEA